MKISFTIPTLNSSKTLATAIASVHDQALDCQVEIIIVDGGSVDNTVDIAESHGATVIRNGGKLLGARRRGLEQAAGQVIVLLDSDQVLRAGSISASRELLRNGHDMVVLGERVYQPHSLTQRLSDLDKELLGHDVGSQLNPVTGVMLPRVFRRELLEEALSRIPPTLDDIVVAHDHAIIYFECFNISSKVGYVPEAVWHLEPQSILTLWQKNFRYGWSTRQLLSTKQYAELVSHKTRTRSVRGRGQLRLRLGSLGFLALKAIAYASGYAVGGRFGSPA